MQTKPYHIPETEHLIAAEPAVAYSSISLEPKPSSDSWNPNVPFHGTQEEWWEHFHRIEEGNFVTWEEHQKKFNEWKQQFLKSLS